MCSAAWEPWGSTSGGRWDGGACSCARRVCRATAAAIVYGWGVSQSGAAAILHNFRTLGHFPWYDLPVAPVPPHGAVGVQPCHRATRFSRPASWAWRRSRPTRYPFLATALLGYGLGRRPGGSSGGYRVVGCLLFVTLLECARRRRQRGQVRRRDQRLGVRRRAAQRGGGPGRAGAAGPSATRAQSGSPPAASSRRHGGRVPAGIGPRLPEAQPARAAPQCRNPSTRSGSTRASVISRPTRSGTCWRANAFRPNLDVVYSYSRWRAIPSTRPCSKRLCPPGCATSSISKKMEGWGGAEVRRLLPEESEPTDALGLKFHDVLTRP